MICRKFLVYLGLLLVLIALNIGEITAYTHGKGRMLLDDGKDLANTVRSDPLDTLKKYRGGFDITNKHYWSASMKARTKPVVPPSPDPSVKVRTSYGLNNSRIGEEHAVMASQKDAEVKALGRSGNRPFVEQFLRPRRRCASVDLDCKKNEDVIDSEKKELHERLSCNENLVKILQSEVLELKAQLESLHTS